MADFLGQLTDRLADCMTVTDSLPGLIVRFGFSGLKISRNKTCLCFMHFLSECIPEMK